MSVEIPDYLPDAVKAEIQTRFTRLNTAPVQFTPRIIQLSKQKIIQEEIAKFQTAETARLSQLEKQRKEETQQVFRYAVQQGDFELAEEALERGADILHSSYYHSIKPIVFYVNEPNVIEKLQWLVGHGANINARTETGLDRTILHKYLFSMSIPNLERLHQLGARFDAAKDANGDSLLHTAVTYSDDEALFAFLVDKGIPVDIKGFDAGTPITDAIMKENYTAVRWLLEHGANVNQRSHWPYYTLLNYVHIPTPSAKRILQLLLDYGINFEPTINGDPTVRQITNPFVRRELINELARRQQVRNAQRKLPHVAGVETLLEQRPNIPENVGALMASQLTGINHASIAQQRAQLQQRINTMTRKPPRRITNSVLGPVNTSLFEGGRRKRNQKKTRRRN